VLREKIETKEAKICIIGLGYVGLPLAVNFAEAGYMVAGYDVNRDRVKCLQRGESYVKDVEAKRIAALLNDGRLFLTSYPDVLGKADILFICVPTPLDKVKKPDLSYVITAVKSIPARQGQLIILQSTTYPGTTEKVVRPILERSGLVAGEDFHLAFSPERINPGDGISIPPRVVGGITPECAELARAVLLQIAPSIHVVSSPRVAEMTKLYENVFRGVNIAFANEMALLCDRMGIDPWEVIEAASTKPFGFMPFHPGPGVGGHCIPINPHYLKWAAQQARASTGLMDSAITVNRAMPLRVVEKIEDALGANLAGKRILLLGMAFKENVDDARNSAGQRIMGLLDRRGAEASFNDPHVPKVNIGEIAFFSQELTDSFLASQDCVVVVTPHRAYDFQRIARHAPLIVDTRNVLDGEGFFYKVVR
jgi:UDP-N-acetyl-D-glucosamine dehydrogenase